MERAHKGTRINIYLSPAEKKRLQQLAKSVDRSASWVLRQLLNRGLETWHRDYAEKHHRIKERQ